VNNASPEAWPPCRHLSIDDCDALSGGDEWMLDLTAPIFTQPYSAPSPPARTQPNAGRSKHIEAGGLQPHAASVRTHDAVLIGLRDSARSAQRSRRSTPSHARSPHAFAPMAGLLTSLSEFARSHASRTQRQQPRINLRENGVDAIPERAAREYLAGPHPDRAAPLLFARSDSFLIRTHGESTTPPASPRPGWLESLVQRMPARWIRPTGRTPLPHRFKRWLRDNEK
jgi:hypothetical protein